MGVSTVTTPAVAGDCAPHSKLRAINQQTGRHNRTDRPMSTYAFCLSGISAAMMKPTTVRKKPSAKNPALL